MFYCNIIDNNETVSSKTGRCGTIDYDPDLYICCNEVINSKADKKQVVVVPKVITQIGMSVVVELLIEKISNRNAVVPQVITQISLFVVVELLDTKAETQLVVVP